MSRPDAPLGLMLQKGLSDEPVHGKSQAAYDQAGKSKTDTQGGDRPTINEKETEDMVDHSKEQK